MVWMVGFTDLLAIKLKIYPFYHPPSLLILTLSALLNLGLLLSDFLGGELVFKLGIGKKVETTTILDDVDFHFLSLRIFLKLTKPYARKNNHLINGYRIWLFDNFTAGLNLNAMTFVLFFAAFIMLWGITCWAMIKTGFIHHLHSKVSNETIHLSVS